VKRTLQHIANSSSRSPAILLIRAGIRSPAFWPQAGRFSSAAATAVDQAGVVDPGRCRRGGWGFGPSFEPGC
jgi:hypothetical protein